MSRRSFYRSPSHGHEAVHRRPCISSHRPPAPPARYYLLQSDLLPARLFYLLPALVTIFAGAYFSPVSIFSPFRRSVTSFTMISTIPSKSCDIVALRFVPLLISLSA